MPTLYVTANKSSAFLERISDGLRVGAGADHHMPASPSWSGHRERSACGFSLPSSTWDGMGAVSEVALLLTTTGSGVHVGRGSSPACELRRITESWTPNGDSMDSGSATTAGLVYPGPSATGTNAITITSSGSGGEQDLVRDITKLAKPWLPSRLGGSGSSCYGVMLLQGSNTSDTTEFYSSRAADSWKRPQLRITYTADAGTAPGGVSLVSPLGSLVNASTFAFTSSDVLTAYDLQVSTDKTFATVSHWNVTNAAAGLAVNGKSVSAPYTGIALTPTAPTYWWRARGRNTAAGPWSSAGSFTVDPAALPQDQYDAWARHILADLAAPRRHTVLGTIYPIGPEVLPVASTDYQGRWYVRDANHGTPIERVIEVVGITLHADATNGWALDATTHDLGGPELIPPTRPYSERVLSGDYAPRPGSHWSLGETAGTFADSAGSYPGSMIGAVSRGVAGLSPGDTDGALSSSTAGGVSYGTAAGDMSGSAAWSVGAWVKWDGSGELAVLDKVSGSAGTWAGWRAFVNGVSGKLQTYTGDGANLPTAQGATALVVGRAYHCVWVWDTDAIRFYLDGVLDGTGTRTDPAIATTRPLYSVLRGTIDELSLWLEPLTAAQVWALYSPPPGG